MMLSQGEREIKYARRRAASDAATRAKVLDRYGDGGASVVTLGGGAGRGPHSDPSSAPGRGAAPSEEEARRLLYGASERYVEYSKATGKPIPSAAAAAAAALAAGGDPAALSGILSSSSSLAMPRSALYDEDVFPGNHSSVWGSWWHAGTRSWGYSCCHSTTRNAYCLGEAGKRAAAAAREQLEANMRSLEEQKKQHQEREGAAAGGKGGGASGTGAAASLYQRQRQSAGASIGAGLFADDSGASALDVGELDEGKLRAALAAEDARKRRERKEREREREEEEEEHEERRAKRKRKKGSSASESGSGPEEDERGEQGEADRGRRRRGGASSDVNPSSSSGLTAEELEAYRLLRERADDPMLRQQQQQQQQQAKGKGKGKGEGKGDGYDLV